MPNTGPHPTTLTTSNANGNSNSNGDGNIGQLWEDAERQIRQAAVAGGSTTVSVKSSKPASKRKLDEGKDKHAEEKEKRHKSGGNAITGRESRHGKDGKEKKRSKKHSRV